MVWVEVVAVGLVTVPRILCEKLGDDGVDALVEFLNSAQVVQRSALDLFAERLELRLDALSREFDGKLDAKLDGLRNFVLVVVSVGVAFLSLVVVFVRWLGK
jgi:hypothetical protein